MKAEHPSGFDFEVIVVGGGSAGYAAARTTSAAGLRTAVVEGARELGGLCILRGCMPTKALLQAADVLHLTQRAGLWGVKAGKVGFDFDQVLARKKALIDEFAADRRGQLSGGTFTLVKSRASFLDAHTLDLDTGGTLRGRSFVIATGSMVSSPPLPGLSDIGPLTSDEAQFLPQPPRSLIILGGGAVAVEFAQFFARFGTHVTLVQRSARLLREFDPDMTGVVEAVLQREGVSLFTGTQLSRMDRRGGLKEVSFEWGGETKRVKAGEILVALGRQPNTDSLGLEKIGVQTIAGRIVADPSMRTRVPHIYAAGDCTGPHDIVHLAVMQGEIAGHNIACPHNRHRHRRRMDDRLHLQVVFTDPQVATVGLTEEKARASGVRFEAASYPFSDHGKSIIAGALDGFVKLLADSKTGEILGGGCVGPYAGELIHEIVAAMAKRMTVHELAAMPHYHPTLAEIWTYPAESLAARIS